VHRYDYIVVGAGSAGCVLAARLSQDPAAQVLLLEAGSGGRTRAMTVPNAWPENLTSPANWGNTTTAQAEAGPVVYPRGRALGGSSAINAMAHVRGHRTVYDGWAADGASGWGFADLLPYFRRSETAAGRDPMLRGTAGPIRVAPAADRHPVALAFVAGLLAEGYPDTDDLSGERQEGVAWTDLAIADGERISSADGYLRPTLGRPNLVVLTDCLVTRLELKRGRCTGVSYVRDGRPATARTSGEVVLSAGAIGTPQLLMLSGIGPARHLRAVGIDPVADLPQVGENLQDHPIAITSYSPASLLPASKYNHGEACAAVRSGLAGHYPDLHLLPILLPLAPAGYELVPAGGYALVASAVAPSSRGVIRLATADAQHAPVIDPGFLRDPKDLDRLEAGLLMIRETAAGPAFGQVRQAEIWPGPDVRNGADIRRYIRRTVSSYYHPVGTCRMGSDSAAVVDCELRVRGLTGLRIADASVLPTIPNAHPNATVLAVAERAAELISGRSLDLRRPGGAPAAEHRSGDRLVAGGAARNADARTVSSE
jgi:choline dehydrogenase